MVLLSLYEPWPPDVLAVPAPLVVTAVDVLSVTMVAVKHCTLGPPVVVRVRAKSLVHRPPELSTEYQCGASPKATLNPLTVGLRCMRVSATIWPVKLFWLVLSSQVVDGNDVAVDMSWLPGCGSATSQPSAASPFTS